MKGFRSGVAIAAKLFSRCLALAIVAALLLSTNVLAYQQPATSKKKSPRLTTDDVIPVTSAQTADKSEGEARLDAPASSAGEAQVSAEEAAWREQVSAARERAKAAERAADEMELRITELRNRLGVSGQTARDRNETAQELEQAGQQLTELRARERAAADELKKLLEQGHQKKFSEDSGPKPSTGEGRPNEQYYRTKFAALNEELQTAERRVQLYENRVRELNQRIQLNSGSGDNFFIMKIQQERDEAQQKLDESIAARDKAQSDINNLLEEARRAGVPPGVFR